MTRAMETDMAQQYRENNYSRSDENRSMQPGRGYGSGQNSDDTWDEDSQSRQQWSSEGSREPGDARDYGRSDSGGYGRPYRGQYRDQERGDQYRGQQRQQSYGGSQQSREPIWRGGYDQQHYGQGYGQQGGQDYNRGSSQRYGQQAFGQNYGSGAGGSESYRGKGPKGYQRSDERLKEVICELLSDDSALDASNISLTVKNGEVTLEGSVRDRWSKHRAEDLVDDCSGVKEVRNNLRVEKAQDSWSSLSGSDENSAARSSSSASSSDGMGSSGSRSSSGSGGTNRSTTAQPPSTRAS